MHCHQEGKGVGLVLLDKEGRLLIPKGFPLHIGTHQASEPQETLLKNVLEAHRFFMPKPQQSWHFELAEAL